MDNAFWKSWPGVATITGLGVAAAAAVAYAVSKASGTSTSAPAGTTPGAPAAGQQYYLFTLTTTYPNTDPSGTPVGTAYTTTMTALGQAGFTQLQVEEDPLNPNGWIGTGLWTASGSPTIAATTGTFTSMQVSAETPPTPTNYTGLVAGTWYTFTLETDSNLTTTTPGALLAVQGLAVQLGWAPPTTSPAAATGTGMLISPSSSNNTKWNVVAQWAGTIAVGSQPALPTSSQDRPPLIIYAPPVGSATTNAAPVPQASQPTTVSVA
jgi:hypothetical protein